MAAEDSHLSSLEFSLRKQEIPLHDVMNQGKCRSCWAMSSIVSVNTEHARLFKIKKVEMMKNKLSAQHIVDCLDYSKRKIKQTKDEDLKKQKEEEGKKEDGNLKKSETCKPGSGDGCITANGLHALQFFKQWGVCRNRVHEYKGCRDRDPKLPKGEVRVMKIKDIGRILKPEPETPESTKKYHAEIKSVLREGRTIICSIPCGPKFRKLKKGDIYCGEDEVKGKGGVTSHSVLITGFGKKDGMKIYEFMNHHGTKFCDKGFGLIRRDLVKSLSYPLDPFVEDRDIGEDFERVRASWENEEVKEDKKRKRSP